MTVTIQHFDVIGQATLSQVESRLRERGYRPTDGQLVGPGLYSWYHSDGAPGWSDWTYTVSVAVRDGDELRVLLEGL